MNIIYTLTNRTYSVIRGLSFAILGMCLLFWPASMLNIIVKILAAFLIGSALVSLLFMQKQHKVYKETLGNNLEGAKEHSFLSSFASISVMINIAFGVLIFIFPAFFVSILVFLFGAILLILGLGQLANLFLSGRHAAMPSILYIFPAIITICGIILFFQPFTAKDVLTMFFGACTATYGIIEIFSAWIFRKVKFGANGKYMQIEEAQYEEIK